MSIHCLICSHQGNWRDEGEVEVDDNTWVVIKVHNDYLLDKPKSKKEIEEWWVHRDCLQKWLEEDVCADTKLKYKPKRI